MRPWFVIDTETTAWTEERMITIPDFVVAGWCTSDDPDHVQICRSLLETRTQVQAALDAGWVVAGHNLAFDLAVLGIVPRREHKLFDTLIADLLQRLAYNDCWDDVPGPPRPRSLEALFGRALSGKGDTQRTFGDYRFAPLPAEHERYLRDDVLATRHVFVRLSAFEVPGSFPEMVRQVRARMALDAIGRTGLRIDENERRRQCALFNHELARLRGALQPQGFYRPESSGPRGGKRKGGLEQKKFQEYVFALARQREAWPAQTPTGKTAIGEADLAPFKDDETVRLWLEYKDTEKILHTFLEAWGSRGEYIRSNYHLLMRTGRTSCSDPNLQQVPSRGTRGGVKSVFVAPPGRVFFELDYAQLELCCLAQLTRGRMLQLINEGKDLHRELGAVYFRKPVAEVTKEERQLMKCATFGLPGGMGIKKFRTFIMDQGLPDPGEARVADLKNAWLEAYPEMEEWLIDEGDRSVQRARRIWSGRDDTESEAFVNACWDIALHRLGQMRDRVPRYVYAAVLKGRGSGDVETWVSGRSVVVPGGRRRFPVSYTEQRNTRFQGLAADLAKEALASIILDHPDLCTVHAFVHDSVLISVPDDATRTGRAELVADLMLDAAAYWLPQCRTGVEISGPGRSWLDAKTGPKAMKNREVKRN